MAKQLNVDLSVRANTDQAKQALASLNKSLNDIMSTQTITINDTSINNAKQAAMDLRKHLEAAVDVNTGKLDLSKFSMSLTKSGQSLQGLYNNLSKVGPSGQQAFLALSKSITLADSSALTLGSRLTGLLTSLKNTVRWQLSSSLLHGIMGAAQQALGYAEDLNKSLNNIRIVTGQSTEEMAQFAKQANEAAQALSTRTTSYTDAALIYYQQGIRDQKEIAARTETTIKMANVSRQSAEDVSNQMTAIWNNFYDGSKSIEYYADAITALGANTASSSEEIATGLEKFSAVADTVGLSYEYATSALATITATTRQSADVVGTALKTLFARIQDLELGKTLEDGTSLGKYSQALAKIGVSIKDANGEVRKMDSILDDLGSKWNTISKDQQIALAQTVAGTRQYAQLIALMDNWDFMKENVSTVENSEGTLQQQQDIYAEGWEAASKRVKAALEDIYSKLLDDKFFINTLNGLEKIINAISNIMDGLGGLKGILMLIGSIVLNRYAKELPAFFERMISNIKVLTGHAEKNRQTMLEQNMSIVESMVGKGGNKETEAQIAGMSKVSKMTLELARNRQDLSEAEIASYESKIKEAEAYSQVAEAIGKEVDALQKEAAAQKTDLSKDLSKSGKYGIFNLGDIENDEERAAIHSAQKLAYSESEGSYDEAYNKRLDEAKKKVEELNVKLKEVKQSQGDASKEAEKLEKELKKAEQALSKVQSQGKENSVTGKDLLNKLEEAATKYGKMSGIIGAVEEKTKMWEQALKDASPEQIEEINKEITAYLDEIDAAGGKTKEVRDALDDLQKGKGSVEQVVQALQDLHAVNPEPGSIDTYKSALVALGANSDVLDNYVKLLEQGKTKEEAFKVAMQGIKDTAEQSTRHFMGFSEVVGGLGSIFMQLSMAINAFKRIGEIWNNDDLSSGEKFLQILSSIGMLLPAITVLINKQKIAELGMAAARILGKETIKGKTLAELEEMTVQEAATAVGYAALGPLLIFVAIAAGVVALIMGIVYAIKKLVDSYNADAIAAEKASKAAKEVSNALQETKDKADELHSAFDNYDSVVDKLNECTKGTQEWRDALAEVNQAVLDIISEYPELASALEYHRDENGQLVIDNAEQILAEADAAVERLQLASIEANAQASKAGLRADSTATNRKYYQDEYIDNGEGYYSYDEQAAAGNKAIKEITDNFAEGKIKQYLDEAGVFRTEQELLQQMTGTPIDKFTDLTEDAFKDLAATLGMSSYEFHEFYKSISELAGSAKNVATELDKAAFLSANQVLDGEYDNLARNGSSELNTDIKNAIVRVGGEAYQAKYDEIYQNVIDASHQYTQAQRKGDLEEEGSIWRRYLDAIGENYQTTKYELDNNAIRGDIGSREYYFNNGEEDTHISEEAMARIIAAAEAMDAIGPAAEGLAKQFATMSVEAQGFTADVINSRDAYGNVNFSQLMGGFSAGEFSQLSQATDVTSFAQLLNMTPEQLENLATTNGFESGQAFFEAFQASASEEDFWDNFNIDDKMGIGSFGWAKDLSLTTAKALQAAFDDMSLGPLGEKAGKQFVNGLNDMVKGLKPEDQQAALDRLMQIDWSNYYAGKEAAEIMADYGIEVENTVENWDDFIEAMRIANFAQPDFEHLRDTLKEISTIIQGLDFGKTIKDEDYQKLIEYGKELGEAWDQFFIAQADGSYKFIGNQQQMMEATRANLSAEKTEMQQRAELVKKLNESSQNINWSSADALKEAGISSLVGNTVFKNLAADLGYSDERLNELIELSKSDIEKLEDEEKKALELFYQEMANAAGENYEMINEQIDEMVASTASNYSELLSIANTISPEAFDKRVAEIAHEISETAATLDELRTGLGSLGGTENFGEGENIFYDEYAQGLLKIASNYESCAEAAIAYQNALTALNNATDDNREELEKVVKTTEDHLEVMIQSAEAAEKYGLEVKDLNAQLNEIVKTEGVTEKQALQMAVANQRMNRGVAALVNNWKDWKKFLQSADNTAEDFAATLVDVSEAVADLVGWYEDLNLDSTFVTENMELIDKAAGGDTEAILELGAAVAQYEVAQATLNETISHHYLDGTADAFQAYVEALNGAKTAAEAFVDIQANVNAGFNALQANMANLYAGKMDLDAALSDVGGLEAWVQSLNQYAAATGMTAQEMQDMLTSVGVTANVQTDYEAQRVTVPTYHEYSWVESTNYASLSGQTSDGKPLTSFVPQWHKVNATVMGPPMTTEGYVEVASIQMEDSNGVATPPQFTGRKAPSSTALTGGTGNSPKTSSGGGGGGKSSQPKFSQKEPKEMKQDKPERYHVVSEQLEDLTRQYDNIDKAANRAFGISKIKLLDAQIKKQDELINKNKQYLEEAKNWLKQDKDALEKIVTIGVQYDENGAILNYEDIWNNGLAQYNAMIQEYNDMAMEYGTIDQSSSEGEARAKSLEDKMEEKDKEAQKFWEDFTTALDTYEETVDIIAEKSTEIIDGINEKYDLLLAKTKLGIELRVDVDDEALDLLNRQFERIQDNAYKAADAIANLGKQTALQLDKAAANRSGLTGILANHNISTGNGSNDEIIDGINNFIKNGGKFTAEEIEAIREFRDGILDSADALLEARNSVFETLGNTIDDQLNRLDRQVDKISYLRGIVESYQNIIDVAGRKSLGFEIDMINTLSQRAQNISFNNLAANRKRMETEAQELFEARKAYNELANEEDKRAMEEHIQNLEDRYQESVNNFYSAFEEAAQSIRDTFDTAITGAIEDFDEALAGAAGNLDGLQAQFETFNATHSTYIEDYEKQYQLTKLQRNVMKSIDATDNLRAQNELLKIQQEIIDAQTEGRQMSEYELEILQKKYDLKMAEIALDEAQNEKTEVRMQRDSNGSFSYVYTANADDVAKAEQDYSDKLYEMQKANQEYIEEMQANLLSLESDYKAKLQEAADMYDIGTEEFYHAVEQIDAWYRDAVQTTIDQLGIALNDAGEITTDFAQRYIELTGDVNQANAQLITSWEETKLATLSGYKDLTAMGKEWLDSMTELYNNVVEASNSYSQSLDQITGGSEHFGEVIEAVTSATEKSTKTLTTALQTMATDVTNTINNALWATLSWSKTYSDIIEDMIGKSNSLAESLNTVIVELSTIQKANLSTGGIVNISQNDKGETVTTTYGAANGGLVSSTGLLQLHGTADEPELVLNPEDTQNMLSMTSMVREISKIIELNAAGANSGLASLLKFNTPFGSNNGTLQQEVHITAEFPNATDKDTILEAFDNIINLASQYANQKV